MLRRWKTISSRIVAKNPWWTYKVDQYEIPADYNGEYHFVHTNGASMVVPITSEGKVILVNQYRYLCNRESIEFPCGGVKDGATYDSTARMELEEETGYRTDDIERVAEFNPYNGVTDEMCAVYIAKNLTRSLSHPDVTEEFEIVECSVDELNEMTQSGRIWDGMTLAAWMLARSHVER